MKFNLGDLNSKRIWVLLIFCFVFIILRFPSMFEPNWYGDEGIYQAIGYGLRSGRDFYTGVWDNKPPLLFVIYALAGGDQFIARFMSIIFGVGALIAFYSLTRKIFHSNRMQFISTIFFVLFFGLPIIEGNIANSENFMLFPIVLSANILYPIFKKFNKKLIKFEKRNLLLGGIILSLSFLIKIVTIFDFAAFLIFSFFISCYSEKLTLKTLSRIIPEYSFKIIWFLAGFILPVIVSFIYFYIQGVLPYYLDAAFGRNVDYVGWANYFIIPQGLLYLRIILLGVVLFSIFIKRRMFSPAPLFILIWTAFSLFNAFFSNRGYTHYMLLVLPSLSLLVGLIFKEQLVLKKVLGFLLTIVIISTLYFNFAHWSLRKTASYYLNYFKLISGNITFRTYQEFFDPRNPKDYMIAEYINKKTNKKDIVFLWGNSAQIYPLSETLPPGRYSAAYHIINNKNTISETEKALNKNVPKYIIITQDISFYPFDLSDYTYLITIADSHIYEHTNK